MQRQALIAAATVLALAACAPAKAPEPAAAPPSAPGAAEAPAVGMANPASVACVDNGGTLKTYDTPEGQIGICTTRLGEQCEEWALFRDGKCEPPPADAVLAPGQDG